MKKTLLLLLCIIPMVLHAQRVEREFNGKVVVKDREGYIIEKRSIDKNGNFVVEDPSGRVLQIIRRDIESGDFIVEDGEGNLLEVRIIDPHNNHRHDDFEDFPYEENNISIRDDIFGNTLYERDGRTLFKVGKNIFDEKFIEDGNGRTLRKFKRDIFGNKIVEGENGKKIMSFNEDNFRKMLERRGITEEEWESDIINQFIYSRWYK